MKNDRVEKGILGAKNVEGGRSINSVWGLIGFCLKSKEFGFLFILMMGIFIYEIIMARQTIAPSNEEMGGFTVMFNWISAALFFFIIIVMDMLAVTKKIKKTFTSVFLFAIMTAAIPVIVLMFYFRYLVFGG